MGISRQCASKWVDRFRCHGELGLLDRSSAPHRSPNAIPLPVVARIEVLRRTRKWSARRIALEQASEGTVVSVRTVGRHLVSLGPNRRRFLDPAGDANRAPHRIVARRPGHMVHVDIKKVGTKGRSTDSRGTARRSQRIPAGHRMFRRQHRRNHHHHSDHHRLPGPPRPDQHRTRGRRRRRNAVGGQPDRTRRGRLRVHRRITPSQSARCPGIPFPLARRLFHRRAAHRHRHAPTRRNPRQHHEHPRRTRLDTRQRKSVAGGLALQHRTRPPRHDHPQRPRNTRQSRSRRQQTREIDPIRENRRHRPIRRRSVPGPGTVAGRVERLRHQHSRRRDDRRRGDRQVSRPVAGRAVIPHVENRSPHP